MEPQHDDDPSFADASDLPPLSSVVIAASPDRVFAALADPWTYPEWLVGAQHIRDVDPDWPAVGSRFRHRIGVGPLQVPGTTSVRHCARPTELVLAAGMGPLGEASVRFSLTATPEGTRVDVVETPSRGPARVAWRWCRGAVRVALWGRNSVSLEALAHAVTS